MNKKIFFLLIVFIFNSLGVFSKDQSEKLQNKKLTIYKDNIASLELSGTVSTKDGFVDIRLPESVIEKTVLVECLGKTKIKNIKIFNLVSEEKTYVLNKQEFLLANIGNKISIEVIEGSETINYEGEILPMSQKTEVLLLQNETALMMIPIRQIAHVSVSGNGKFTKDKVIPQKNLRIKFENPKAQENIKLKMMVSDISAQVRYDLFLKDSEILIKAQANIFNRNLDLQNVDIFLNNVFTSNSNDFSILNKYEDSNISKLAFFSLGKQNLYKNEINIYPIFKNKQSFNALNQIDFMDTSIFINSYKIKVKNTSKQNWLMGQYYIHQDEIIDLQEPNFELAIGKSTFLELGKSNLEVKQKVTTQDTSISIPIKQTETSDNRKKRTDRPEIPITKNIQQKTLSIQFTIENPSNKPQFYKITRSIREYFYGYKLKSAELNNSPTEILDNQIEINGNISANKKSVFTYKLIFERTE